MENFASLGKKYRERVQCGGSSGHSYSLASPPHAEAMLRSGGLYTEETKLHAISTRVCLHKNRFYPDCLHKRAFGMVVRMWSSSETAGFVHFLVSECHL